MSEPLTLLHDEEMIGVGFFEENVQLSFRACEINVFAKLFVKANNSFIHPHQKGWRDALCELINTKVISTKSDADDVEIVFENNVALYVSRRAKDRDKKFDVAMHFDVPDFYF
jgi:hypothetical protein